jgi:hypothetical protein
MFDRFHKHPRTIADIKRMVWGEDLFYVSPPPPQQKLEILPDGKEGDQDEPGYRALTTVSSELSGCTPILLRRSGKATE